jgi:superfamily II DNA/RNA helicase
VEVARAASTALTITQGLVASAGGGAKRETLRRLIRGADNFKNAIIFCNRKRDVAILHKSLVSHGFSAGALHGDMDQSARMASLDAFKNGDVALIVCSDVAARGLDIPDVSHVFNFDVPTHAEDYVHRIGRTGRAGRSGTALTIVTREDTKYIDGIQKLTTEKINWMGGTLDDVVETEGHGDERRSRRRNDSSRSGRPERSSSDRGRNRQPESTARAERFARTEPVAQQATDEQPREVREPRAPREDRPARAPRPAREVRAEQPRQEQPRQEQPRQEQPRFEQPRAAQAQPAGDRRRPDRRRNDDDDAPVVGLGDHIPSFLLRPVRLKPAKVAAVED